MWLNYLKIAWRNLLKHKTLSVLNIGGLSIGMAAAILIGSYIFHELNVNQWVPQGDRIFRVYRYNPQWPSAGQANTPAVLSAELSRQFPAIEQATSLTVGYDLLFRTDNQPLYLDEVAFVDSNFLSVFQLPLTAGNAQEALAQPSTAIISESLAQKFFNRTDVVGRTLHFNDASELTVQGVFKDLSGRSHLDFDIFMRTPFVNESWLAYSFETYVLTVPGAPVQALEEQVTDYLDPILLHEFTRANFEITVNDLPEWRLQPLQDVHLHSQNFGAIRAAGGNAGYLAIFGLIGLLLLIIAGINYINLSTARAGNRAQEIGVRKVSGAARPQLIGQFLIESILQSTIAILLALPLASLILPVFNNISGRQLELTSPQLPLLIGGLLALGLVVGLLAGLYPAVIMSGFQPITVLKGGKKQKVGGNALRKILVITQFTGVVVLVILTTVMFRQVQFMLREDLGFTADQVMILPLNTPDAWRRIEARKAAWESRPGITTVSTASVYPGEATVDYTIEIEGHEDRYQAPQMIFPDDRYADLLDLKVLAGRFFSADHASDTLRAFVVNEQFVREYELEQPVGTRIRFPWREEWGEIIGVVEDYHYEGLDTRIEPLAFYGGPMERDQAAIRFQPDQWKEVQAFLDKEWASIESGHPMRYSFLNDKFAGQYTEYQNMSRTFMYSAGLTILVAILGLFGLATFTVQNRTKEIGIRKVLGAGVVSITAMLIRQFISLALIAGLVAAPPAFWFARRWLTDFAYQVKLGIWPFVAGIALALIITLLTVSVQSIQAATANPVKALKSE
jgi:putative ABC transport system permease protein